MNILDFLDNDIELRVLPMLLSMNEQNQKPWRVILKQK